MRRKLIPTALVVVALLFFAVIASRQFGSSAKATYQASAPGRQHPRPPVHISYLFLFQHTASFRKLATQSGKPKAINPMLRREANLNDKQSQAVDEIAAATLQEVEQQDARARAVIEAFRAQFPGGVTPKDKRLPAPPPELRAMQEERDAIILRGRDRLRSELGEPAFSSFDEFVARRFAAKGLIDREQR